MELEEKGVDGVRRGGEEKTVRLRTLRTKSNLAPPILRLASKKGERR